MTRVEIRVATNEEGPIVGKLIYENGLTIEGLNWSDISPYWLVAIVSGEIVGAIQTLPGKPFGRIEILSVKQDLEPLVRARVVGDLLENAVAVIRMFGGQVASGLIPFRHKYYKKVLKKRGGLVLDSGNIIYMGVS